MQKFFRNSVLVSILLSGSIALGAQDAAHEPLAAVQKTEQGFSASRTKAKLKRGDHQAGEERPQHRPKNYGKRFAAGLLVATGVACIVFIAIVSFGSFAPLVALGVTCCFGVLPAIACTVGLRHSE